MAKTSPGFDASSFPALVSGLGAQAQILLGVLDNPLTGRKETPDLNKAAILIQTLEMLELKTRGNLEPEEERFLQAILTDLRLRFVDARRSAS